MPRKAAPLAPGAPPKKPDIRARRVLEIAQLKGENESLKKEREELKDTVTSLKRVVDGEDARDDVERENLLLRNEIAQHQEFIRSLHEILDAEAVLAAQIRGEIYQQGAESARAFVLSLINDSAAWPAAAVPEEVPMPLPDLQFRCSVQPGGTGQPDRLSLRIDLLLPFATQPEVVQNLFFDVFRNEKLTQRLQRASPDVKLQSVDAPTQDTELILFRHDTEKGDKETLFILHRNVVDMTRTTLLLDSPAEEFGTIEARMVCLTSTAMLREASSQHVLGDSLPVRRDASPLSSIVIEGVVAWRDAGGVRLIVVYSVPEDYNIVQDLTFEDLVQKSKRARGSAGAEGQVEMTLKFAQVLAGIMRDFEKLFAELGSAAAGLARGV